MKIVGLCEQGHRHPLTCNVAGPIKIESMVQHGVVTTIQFGPVTTHGSAAKLREAHINFLRHADTANYRCRECDSLITFSLFEFEHGID